MPGNGATESVRFAARIAAHPAEAVGRWRAVTGGKAVGCLPPIPVPEILHAAGMLAVPFHDPGVHPELFRRIDAWVLAPEDSGPPGGHSGKSRFGFPAVPPSGIAESLDLLEALAEWAGRVSGLPVTEGGLGKSLLAFRERRHLLNLLRERRDSSPTTIREEERQDLVRAGDFLPPEAHSNLLARFLRVPYPPRLPPEKGERGDPLLALARRVAEDR